MLEDPNIQHLISWSSNNESFVMSPSTDFSKVLASAAVYQSLQWAQADGSQAILQTYQYIIFCETAEYVRLSQRYLIQYHPYGSLSTDGFDS